MTSKENQPVSIKTTKHKHTQGNDYVLKRYKLQPQKIFEQKHQQEHNFQICQGKQIEQQEQAQDQLIIVPIKMTQSAQGASLDDRKEQHKQSNKPEIYVFDDQEEQEDQVQTVNKSSGDNLIFNNAKGNQQTQEMSPNRSTRNYQSHDELISPQMLCFKNQERLRIKNVHQARCKLQRAEHIKGVKINKYQCDEDLSITITDKKQFSFSRLPAGITLNCIIKRSNSLFNILSPQFDLYLANGLKHVLSAKKYPFKNRDLFKFSADPVKFSTYSAHSLAVMHTNSDHNTYWLLDHPHKVGDMEFSSIYLAIGYQKLVKDTERKFSVLVPPHTGQNQYQLAIDYSQNNINLNSFKGEIQLALSNLQDWENKCENSSKNFVIANQNQPHLIQMTKQADNVFQFTINYPFSPIQAMAVAMTRFDVSLTV